MSVPIDVLQQLQAGANARPGSEIPAPAPVPVDVSPHPFTSSDLLLALNQIAQRIAIATRLQTPLMPAQVVGPTTTNVGIDTQYEFRTNRIVVPCSTVCIINSTSSVAYASIDAPATPTQFPIPAISSGINGYFVWSASLVHSLHVYTASAQSVGGLADQAAGSVPCLWIIGWTNPEWANMKGRT